MPSITAPEASLFLGALDLSGRDQSGPYWLKALSKSEAAGDFDPGNPEPIEREINSLLRDGTLVTIDNYGNRVMNIPIVICAEDYPGLAAGEKALMAETRKRNVLTWTPPNIITGAGDPCVFDVVNSEPNYFFNDGLEIAMLHQAWTITVKALPHARSPIQRSFHLAAPHGLSPVVTPVNACDGTGSGTWSWSSSPGGGAGIITTTPGQYGATWYSTASHDFLPAFVSMKLSGLSTSMATASFVRIKCSATGNGRYGAQTVRVLLNGVQAAEVSRDGDVAWYEFSGATLNTVEIITEANTSRAGSLSLFIDDVSVSNAPQNASGTRQVFGTVEVGGSVRTEAAIAIFDETPVALGQVLFYAAPNVGPVAQPPLRARQSAGPSGTDDTSRVSGKYSDLGTLHSFDTAVTQLPDGTWQLAALVKAPSDGSYTISWAARPRMGGHSVGTPETGNTVVTLVGGVWTIVPIALIPLPVWTLGDAGVVRIDLQKTAGASGLLFDEGWIFNTTTGALAWCDAGTGTPAPGGAANRVWFDSASLEQPSPLVTCGTAADRSDAFAPVVLGAWDSFELEAGSMNIFAMSTVSVAMQIDGYFYPRFHTHVVEPADA